jgi:pimeloyl-ACP methyl ester carboxylesterase
MAATFAASPTQSISAGNGIDYAYRETGEGNPALVLLQHFRGNLDNWDPALIDALATTRRVITFDNTGVAATGSSTPEAPVFVANGDSDPMILPHYSHLLAGLIPHARVKIYPDSAHGFLFQHHGEFASDVDNFLTR